MVDTSKDSMTNKKQLFIVTEDVFLISTKVTSSYLDSLTSVFLPLLAEIDQGLCIC